MRRLSGVYGQIFGDRRRAPAKDLSFTLLQPSVTIDHVVAYVPQMPRRFRR